MFDVYVSGVDPKRIGEFEEIKKNVGITLNIEGEILDHIVSPEDDLVLIQENVSEKDAIKIRKVLVDIGLLCTYQLRKTSRWGELSIESTDDLGDLFTCPVCNTSGFQLKPGRILKTTGYEQPALCLFWAAEDRPFLPSTMKIDLETIVQINALPPLFHQPA